MPKGIGGRGYIRIMLTPFSYRVSLMLVWSNLMWKRRQRRCTYTRCIIYFCRGMRPIVGWLQAFGIPEANKELVDPCQKFPFKKDKEKDFRCLWDGQSCACGNEHNQNSFSIKSGCLCQWDEYLLRVWHKPKPKIIVTSQICAPPKNEKKKTDLCILQKHVVFYKPINNSTWTLKQIGTSENC